MAHNISYNHKRTLKTSENGGEEHESKNQSKQHWGTSWNNFSTWRTRKLNHNKRLKLLQINLKLNLMNRLKLIKKKHNHKAQSEKEHSLWSNLMAFKETKLERLLKHLKEEDSDLLLWNFVNQDKSTSKNITVI